VPSELADEYHVDVRLDLGPFEVDEDCRSVLRKDELAGSSAAAAAQ
jgi:hypothetical protein